MNRQFEAYFDLFYHFDRKKTIKIFEREQWFTNKMDKLFKEGSNDEKELVHHLKKITRLIVSLVELAIDLRGETALEPDLSVAKK